VWRNGVHTSSLVDIWQKIMREVAAASSPKNKARVEAAILKNKRFTVSELEHDLGLSH